MPDPLSGGTVVDIGGIRYRIFLADDTLELIGPPIEVGYFVAAACGGGGRRNSPSAGGGGGGGGVREGTVEVTEDLAVVVGSGGAGATADLTAGADGQDSSLGAIVAEGGGGGAGAATDGSPGGSGGGGSGGAAAPSLGGAGTVGQGNDGGDGFQSGTSTLRAGGGGGGADGVGVDGASGAGGDGGAGIEFPPGSGALINAGGGGATRGAGPGGASGAVAGGVGGSGASGAGTDGLPVGLGFGSSGGGGGAGTGNGGTGSDGVVFVYYTVPPDVPGMVLEVWRLPANSYVATLETLSAPPMISHPFSGEGAMQVVVPLDAPELALIECPTDGPTDYIRFIIDGELRSAGLIQRVDEHTLDAEGGSKLTATLSGPSVNGVMGHAVVDPSLGVDKSPIEAERLFSWQSPQFDSSGWSDVAQVGAATGTTRVPGTQAGPPAGAPQITGAFWIWDSSGSSSFAPGGTVYARSTFTVGATTVVQIGYAFDNEGLIYIDGIPIGVLSSSGGSGNYLRNHTQQVEVSSGTHTIAIKAFNNAPASDPGPPPNPGGIFCYVSTVASDGELGTNLLVTDSSWDLLGYPSSPPGMTAGEAVGLALTETQTRNALTYLEWDFTDADDSAAASWADTGEISTRTGNDMGTFLQELSVTYVDWRVTPDCTTLELYNHGTMAQVGGSAVVLSAAPSNDANSGQLTMLDRSREAGTGSYLVRHGSDPGGWTRVGGAGDYVVEALLGVPHITSRTEARKQSADELDRLSDGLVEQRFAIDPTTGTVPWVDFGLGDLVEVGGIEYRVRDLPMVKPDVAGKVNYELVVGQVLTPGQRSMLSNKRMANGTDGGRSRIASSIQGLRGTSGGDVPDGGGDCCTAGWQGTTTGSMASAGDDELTFAAPDGSEGGWLYPTGDGVSTVGGRIYSVGGILQVAWSGGSAGAAGDVIVSGSGPDGGKIVGGASVAAGDVSTWVPFFGVVMVTPGSSWAPTVTIATGVTTASTVGGSIHLLGSCACEESVTTGGG